MNLVPKLNIEKRLNDLVMESMAPFKEYARKVESMHLIDEDPSDMLPYLYAMSSIYQQLIPLHLVLDRCYPEYKEVFQRLMMLQNTHYQMEGMFRTLLNDADNIARKIKEMPKVD